MATVNDLLLDALDRVKESVHGVVGRLSDQQLATRVAPDANTVAWLVWHLTRIMDDHIAAVQGDEQVWTDQGWAGRFGLPFDPGATGYGQAPGEVAQVRVTADLLLGYYDAAHDYVVGVIGTVTEADLDRIVDRRWDPPVTLAVRLVSVVNDATQHVGQAAYVAGILDRS
ncbi:MAG: DinB family protein [Actinomycetota bacterium]|nr:DinB family protein [Actinomycetota bacterium]